MTDEKPKLSKADEVFVSEYLLLFNATAAYKKAHPTAKDTTAASNGWKLLRKTEIRDVIQSRLDEVHMSADEALKLTADIARGDIASLMEITSVGGSLDLKTAQSKGLTKLIKKFKQRTTIKMSKSEDGEDVETHDIEIELYDAQAAQRDILKIAGRYKDTVDITSGGEKIKGYIGWTPENWKQDE